MRDVAQPQQVRAMIFEDRVEDSPTFGCLAIGTMGFEIASSFKPGTKVWDFRTFGTGQGFVGRLYNNRNIESNIVGKSEWEYHYRFR